MKRTLLTVLVAAFSVSLLAQTAAPKIFKRDTNASTYHTANCEFVKTSGFTMVPATVADAMSPAFSACTVCHPERDPELIAAISAVREARAAAERDAAAKVKADADAKAAAAKAVEKAAADAKAATLAEQTKRLESIPIVRLTNLRIRPMITAAVAASKGDLKAFEQRFAASMRDLAPDYAGPVTVVSQPNLSVLALGPVGRMHVAARDAVSKSSAMPPVVWANELQIVVTPLRADSPNITKVIVERNGVVVPPVRSNLAPKEIAGARGAKAQLNAGDVAFPIASFNNGAGVTVKVTLVPASGASIVRTFDALALRKFQ